MNTLSSVPKCRRARIRSGGGGGGREEEGGVGGVMVVPGKNLKIGRWS